MLFDLSKIFAIAQLRALLGVVSLQALTALTAVENPAHPPINCPQLPLRRPPKSTETSRQSPNPTTSHKTSQKCHQTDIHIHIYIYIYLYVYIYICTHIFYDITAQNTVWCCFCGRCETSPHRPRFCMIPPAGKVLVRVLPFLLPSLSALFSVFSISIVVVIIVTKTISITDLRSHGGEPPDLLLSVTRGCLAHCD